MTRAKTQLISLDELTVKRTSAPAAISGLSSTVDLSGGTNLFSSLKSLPTPIDLSNLFTVNMDGSTAPVTVDLSYLKNSSTVLTGATLASEATKFLNRKFGDETTFNFTSTTATANPDKVFTLTDSRVQNGAPIKAEITLSGFADESNVSVEELTKIMQTQVNNSVLGGHARQSVAISGSVNATGLTFLTRAIAGSVVGDTAAQTAQRIVADRAAIISANAGLENVELGSDGTSVVLTYCQFPKQSVALTGTATAASVFMGVAVTGSAVGNTPSQTVALIVANKAAILASSVAGSAAAAGIADIQIDPSDSTKLILVYNQATATRATITPTLTGGITAGASAVLNNINAGLITGTSGGVTPTAIAASTQAPTGTPPVVGLTLGASSVLSAGLATSPMTVTYDYSSQSFKITDSTNAGANEITLASGSANNAILGLSPIAVKLDTEGLSGIKMLPNNKNPLRSITDQRYGMKVSFDAVTKSFSVSSGSTGDGSAITVSGVTASGAALMGLSNGEVVKSSIATRGIASGPAVAVGKPPTVNVGNNFAVDATNNKFIVTVDGIKGTVVVPPSTTY